VHPQQNPRNSFFFNVFFPKEQHNLKSIGNVLSNHLHYRSTTIIININFRLTHPYVRWQEFIVN